MSHRFQNNYELISIERHDINMYDVSSVSVSFHESSVQFRSDGF